MASPMYNPPVPLDTPIPGGCLPGSLIRIQGRVLPTAHSFAINLQTSHSDDIALHINPRFAEQCIVRNSCISSSWGTEERQGPPMPIFPDQNFEILILSDPSFFKIAINGQHFCEFTHRIHPLERVTHLRVQGDLTLTLVQIEGSLTQTSSYAPTAPPIGGGGYGMAAGGGGGALPYPTSGGGLPQPGFSMPPTSGGVGGYPPLPQQPYGGGGAYPPPPQGGGGGYYPPQQPMGGGGAYPPQQPVGGGYPPQGGYYNPGGAQPPQGGYYQPGGAAPPPPHQSGGGGGGLMGSAGKLLAGGLAGVGLAKVANKIPGLGGGGGGHHGYPGGGGGYPGGGHGGGGGGGMGPLGGILGGAGALGIGGALAGKALKKDKKKSKGMMKYALPVGGALVGGYALKKGMKGFGGHHGHGSSSSSSSSSEEE